MLHSTEKSSLLQHKHHDYKLYRMRWYMLAVVALFNFSNAMIWLTFAPVANYTASYFKISETTVNYFSLVYFIASIPFGILCWWIIERFGFRTSAIIGCSINSIGAIVRVIGAYTCTGSTKFHIVLLGQILSACMQPFVLSMPTKIAALWFGDHERTIANTIATMSNPLGVLLANAIAAGMVTSEKDINLMLLVEAIPAVIVALMAIFGVHSSKPAKPPAASALIEPVSFFIGIKTILHNKAFLLLAMTTGMGIASFSTITTIVQQLICPKGYNDTTAAIIGALIIVGGFVGAGISGVYIDRTRKYTNVAKIFALTINIFGATILISSNLKDMTWFLIISFIGFGFFALGALPVFLELGVECTYPVDEATSSGIQWLFGQVFGSIMLVVGSYSAPDLNSKEIAESACNTATSDINPVNFALPTVVITLLCATVSILFVMFFETDYKRLDAELNTSDSEDEEESDGNNEINEGRTTASNNEYGTLPTLI